LLKNFFSNETRAIELDLGDTSIQHASTARDSLRGVYASLGNDCVGLFAIDDRLFIVVNAMASEVLSHETRVTYLQKGNSREIRVGPDSATRLIRYECGTPVSTPFYSEDEEDADFGRWLYNVLCSDERKNIFIASWANRAG
jgi:hypothetical protein